MTKAAREPAGDLVGASRKSLERATARRIDHRGRGEAALPRYEADVETADTGSGRVEDAERDPVLRRPAKVRGKLCGRRENGGATGAHQRALSDEDQRALGRLQQL